MPVTYDRNSFFINGQRVFLTSGDIHYFRTPRALWRDRLEKAQAAGLNTLQLYVAWNWHEARPGQFDFTGERDLDHFLTLAEELGLYIVARPGPYICAEWEFGGFPTWLMQTAGIQLRRYDPIYLRYVDRYFEQVLPIIARHQIDAQGADGRKNGVILVQAENELGLVARADGEAYMRHLVGLYRRLGITVPIITCEGGAEGTIECVNAHAPADKFAALRAKQPDAPIHCTEFWPGWYETWDRPGPQYPRSPAVVERETWRVLALGGAGYNYYMWHGGTNFAYTTMYLNITANYLTAPLSQAGGIGEKYRRCRRVAWFAQSFADILTNAHEGDCSDMERDTTLGANFFQRVSEQGKILFVENPNPARVGIYLYINGISQDLFVPAESVRPVVYNVPIGRATLALCTAGVLGRWTHDDTTLLVVHGEPGVTNRAIVALQIPTEEEPLVSGDLIAEWREADAGAMMTHSEADSAVLLEVEHSMVQDLLDENEQDAAASSAVSDENVEAFPGGLLIFTLAFGETPQTAEFTIDGHAYRLLALPNELADRTWWNPATNALPTLFIGAQTAKFEADGSTRLGWNEENARGWRWEAGKLTTLDAPPERTLPEPPPLTDWQYHDGEIESAVEFDDSRAVGMFAPINRVLLDAQPGYAWYRTTFDSPTEREAALTFTAFADRILVFLNGDYVTDTFPPAEERVADPALTAHVRLRAGRNVLAVLTDTLGHVKGEWQFRGRPMAHDKKGLFGDVLLDYSQILHNWRFLPGLTAERDAKGEADLTFQVNGPLYTDEWDWQPTSAAGSGKRLRWYRATFHLSPEELAFPDRELMLDVIGMGKGVIWLNGTNLGRYWTINGYTHYYLPKCWMAETNTLLLFEETDKEPSSVRLAWDDVVRVASWQTVM